MDVPRNEKGYVKLEVYKVDKFKFAEKWKNGWITILGYKHNLPSTEGQPTLDSPQGPAHEGQPTRDSPRRTAREGQPKGTADKGQPDIYKLANAPLQICTCMCVYIHFPLHCPQPQEGMITECPNVREQKRLRTCTDWFTECLNVNTHTN